MTEYKYTKEDLLARRGLLLELLSDAQVVCTASMPSGHEQLGAFVHLRAARSMIGLGYDKAIEALEEESQD